MPRFPAELVEKTSAILEELKEISPTLVLAVVLSDDGFELTRTPKVEAEDGRFSSMASSVQALSEAVIHERELGRDDAVIIQAAKGKLIQLRLAPTYILSAQFTNDDLLGRNLIDMRKVATKLRVALAGS